LDVQTPETEIRLSSRALCTPDLKTTDLLTEDIATFGISIHILNESAKTISQLLEDFKHIENGRELIFDLLSDLTDSKAIEISGNSINVLDSGIHIPCDPKRLKRFLPKLFEHAVEKTLNDTENGTVMDKQEGAYFWTLPDNPEIAKEAKEIFVNFRTEITNFAKRHKTSTGYGTRFFGIIDTQLKPEDFE